MIAAIDAEEEEPDVDFTGDREDLEDVDGGDGIRPGDQVIGEEEGGEDRFEFVPLAGGEAGGEGSRPGEEGQWEVAFFSGIVGLEVCAGGWLPGWRGQTRRSYGGRG